MADRIPIALDFDSCYRSDYRSLVGLAVVTFMLLLLVSSRPIGHGVTRI